MTVQFGENEFVSPEMVKFCKSMLARHEQEKEKIIRKQEMRKVNTRYVFQELKTDIAIDWLDKTGTLTITHDQVGVLALRYKDCITGGIDIDTFGQSIKNHFRHLRRNGV